MCVCHVILRCLPHAFNNKVATCNELVHSLLELLPYLFCWFHQGGFHHKAGKFLLADGVYANHVGQYCLYRSYRGTILKALTLLWPFNKLLPFLFYLSACLFHCFKLFYIGHASAAMILCATLDSLYCFEPLLFLSAWASIEVYCSRVYVPLKDSILTHYYFLDLDPRLFYSKNLDPHFSLIFLGLWSKIILSEDFDPHLLILGLWSKIILFEDFDPHLLILGLQSNIILFRGLRSSLLIYSWASIHIYSTYWGLRSSLISYYASIQGFERVFILSYSGLHWVQLFCTSRATAFLFTFFSDAS